MKLQCANDIALTVVHRHLTPVTSQSL